MKPESYLHKQYFVWFAAVILLMSLIIRISIWRVDHLEQELHDKMISQTQNFTEAISESFIQYIESESVNISEKNYRKYVGQLNLYQVHMRGPDIYGLKPGAQKGIIAIAAETSNAKYTLGSEYPDPGAVYDEIIISRKPTISEPYRIHGNYFYTVLTPVIDQTTENIKIILGIDFPAEEALTILRKSRLNSLLTSLFFLFIFTVSIVLIIWRDRKAINLRKKYRHIESYATLATGIFLTLLSLKLSFDEANHEREAAFKTIALPHQKSVQKNFIEIKKKLDILASFITNSDDVTQREYKSFTSKLFEDLAVESVLMFSLDKYENVKNSESEDKGLTLQQKQLHLEHVYNRGSSNYDSDFFKSHAKIIQQLMLNALMQNNTHSSEPLFVKSSNTKKNVIVLATPIFKPDNQSNTIDKHDLTGILLTTIEPQKIFSSIFSASNWSGELVNVGLVEMKDDNMHDWLAAFPKEHLDLHHEDHILEHTKEFNYSNVMPLFVFNKSFGVVAHSTKTLESTYGTFRNYLILITGLLATLALFILVRFIRNRWYTMEMAIEERTESLKRKVKDLSCLKNIGDELQKEHTPASLFKAIMKVMKQSCLEGAPNDISIVYKNEELGTALTNQDSFHIQVPILENGKKNGSICIFNAAGIKYSKEDIELLKQIGDSISMWISHHQSAAKLKESEDNFLALIENAFDGIYLLEGMHFKYANKAFLKMLEYDKSELLSETFDLNNLLTEKSKAIVKERFEARQSGKELAPRYEFQQLTKSGKIRDVEVSTISVKQEGKQIIMGILRDITERKAAENALHESEEKLQQQNEELQVLNEELLVTNNQIRDINQDLIVAREKAEASDRIKTAFLNNISHEVRTPLNGILGASVLISETGMDEKERHDLISIINQSTNRLIRTITQYMDISLLQSGQMECNIAPLEVNELIRKLVGEFTQEAIENKLKLNVVNQLSKENALINSDKELIEKILTHVLDNAIKFTHQGGIDIIIRENYPSITFEINDTGIGIDPSFQKQVFNYFTQEDYGNMRKYDGSGLGLAICHGICKILGGSISFKSVKDKGSTFIIEIPVKTTLYEKTSASDETIKKASQQNDGPVILIAEDEESNFVVMSMLLQKRMNAQVFRAENGVKAVELTEKNKNIDLVLMDIKMPIMDGYEATKHIKIMRPELPVIAITAYGLTGDESKALAAGCDDFLAKPVGTNDLINKISRYLSDKKA